MDASSAGRRPLPGLDVVALQNWLLENQPELLGAVPLSADALNHLPPSAVVADRVQCKVPVPPFLIWIFWAAGAPAPVAREKLT